MAVQCRLCGMFSHSNSTTMLFDISNHSFLSKIEDFVGLSLADEENIPRHICESCLGKLILGCRFRDQCRQIQQELFGGIRTTENENRALSNSDGESARKVSEELIEINVCGIDSNTKMNPSGFRDCCSRIQQNPLEISPVREPLSPEFCDVNAFLSEDSVATEKCGCDTESTKSETEKTKLPLVETSPDARENKVSKAILSLRKGKFVQIGKQMSLPKPAPVIIREIKLHPQRKGAENIPPNEKHKTSKMSLICAHCGELFKSITNLKMHEARHRGIKDFACTSCKLSFVSPYLLKVHERVRHLGEKPYSCKMCEKRFFTSTARSQHQQTQHIRSRSYECDECGSKFNTKTDLNRHKVRHTGQKPFRCDVCNTSFPRKTNLKHHYNSKTHYRAATSVVDSQQVLMIEDDDELILTRRRH